MGRTPDSRALDLPLLLRGASAPIGNIRVKEAWTEEQKRLVGQPIQGVTVEEILDRGPSFRDMLGRFALIASGSSGAQGEWPKILMTRSVDGLYYPDSVVADEQAEEHIIVKMSRAKSPEDRLILYSELPYLEIAARFGLRVGKPLSYSTDTLVIRALGRRQ